MLKIIIKKAGNYFFELLVKISIVIFNFFRKLKALKYSSKKFNCIRCGECCSFKVKITNQEIKDIGSLGYKREEFIDRLFGVDFIKIHDGRCFFLENSEYLKNAPELMQDIPSCKIYDYRPKICRLYPIRSFLGIKGKDYRCKGLT